MSRGFTLIELLITVTIGGILLSGALASYRGLGAKQTVKQAGISFQTDVKSYQQRALTGTKPAGCEGILEGYEVVYVNATSYSVRATCSLVSPEATSFSLPQGVEFAAGFNPNEIFFPVLTPAVSGAQTIVLTDDTYNYQVIIESSGVVRGQFL